MRTRLHLLLIFLVVMALATACAPSEDEIQQAIEATVAAPTDTPPSTATVEPAPTATAEATATPSPIATEAPTAEATATAVSFSEIDLGPLLIVEGDLPDHLDGDFVQYGETFRFDREELPEPANLVSQEFYDSEIEQLSGGVAVYLYEDETTASQTYGAVSTAMTGLAGMFSEFRDDVGERAKLEQQGEVVQPDTPTPGPHSGPQRAPQV